MPTVGRRSFLVSGLAAATTACSRAHPSATQPSTPTQSSTIAHTPLGLPGDGELFSAAIIQAFNTTHSTVQLQRVPGGPGAAADLREASVTALGRQYIPLESAIKSSNFDAATIPPSAWTAFTYDGHLRAIPFTQSVWGLLWREDAFKAAHLSPPSTGWTIGDLEAACVELTKLVKSGDLSGLQSALGPLIPVAPGGGAVMPVGLWQSFALGYGGELVTNGHVNLTSASALAGLSTFIDLCRRFASKAVPPLAVPSLLAAPPASWALQFVLLPGVPLPTPFVVRNFLYSSEWKWARMPRFPAAEVILTSLTGEGLFAAPPSHRATMTSALALLMTWALNGAGRDNLNAAGIIPVVATEGAQSRFWTRWSDYASIGDWTHFQDFANGWPTAALASKANSTVAQVLLDAVSNPAGLEAGLQHATLALNASIAQQGLK